MPTPRWAPTIIVYDNEIIWRWSRDRENNDNTGDARIFRQIQTSWRIIALHHVFFVLFGIIDIVVVLVLLGVPLPSFYIQGDRGYKKNPRVGYNCNPIMTLSLVFPNYKI
jgi:hypothetical protein